MEELEDIVVPDEAAAAGFREGLGGDDLPVVVDVFVSVASDLLALAADTSIFVAEGILFGMRVEVDFGFSVLESDGVVVANLCKYVSIRLVKSE